MFKLWCGACVCTIWEDIFKISDEPIYRVYVSSCETSEHFKHKEKAKRRDSSFPTAVGISPLDGSASLGKRQPGEQYCYCNKHSPQKGYIRLHVTKQAKKTNYAQSQQVF